ncbi:MAG: site-specific DNA-methyltransferase, partial [Chloroflexi bacterium]|nr:site-specific DNA-methyltransferase [Chloroflexota bacterium]
MMVNRQMALFERASSGSGIEELARPSGYVGLQAFHKYWGKKPLEPLLFLIDSLSEPGGLVVDPFVGSGSSGVAAMRLNRKFIGIDLNPVAVRLSTLLVSPP